MGFAARVRPRKGHPVCPSTSYPIRGAREHNLTGFDLDIPRDKLVVITGLSGSGKSSLAFDTIYAEGQRRYVESLSAYARQFLGQMQKPDVDHIEGLSPAVSIDQKTTSRNPRSTVGTVTEIYDYLRLLYARVGIPHCPICGRVIERQTPQQIVDRIMELARGTKFVVLAPVVRGRKGEYGKLLEDLRKEGFTRVRVDREVKALDEEIVLDKKYKHDIEVVVDRLVMKPELSATPDGLGGDRPASRGRPGPRRARRRRRAHLLAGVRLPGARHIHGRARSPATSRSTAPTVRVPTAWGSARGSSRIPTSSSRTARCPWAKAPSSRSRAA